MVESKAVSDDTPQNVEIHHGSRTTDNIKEQGRREIARTVLVPEGDDFDVVQLLYSLETYKDSRAMKNYTLYIDKMFGDDRRTKSRVTEVSVTEGSRGIVKVKESGQEIGHFCKKFAESGDASQYWK